VTCSVLLLPRVLLLLLVICWFLFLRRNGIGNDVFRDVMDGVLCILNGQFVRLD